MTRLGFLRSFCAAAAVGMLSTTLAFGQAKQEFPVEVAGGPQTAAVNDDAVEEIGFLSDTSEALRHNAVKLTRKATNRGHLYAGGEYLSIRSTFSENTAFVVTTNDPATANITSTFVPLSFSYDGSYRAFLGYRDPDCGCQVELGFTNFSSGANAATSPVVGTDPTTGIITGVTSAIGDISPPAGSTLTSAGGVDAQAFDLSFSRTIPLGSPPCCDAGCGDSACGDTCGDCCGGWCPAWDITWSGGLRYADVDWTTTTVSSVAPNPGSTTSLDFNGFGARFGLQGRRYFGNTQWFSLFLKGDISLLLGDIAFTTQTASATTGTVPPTLNTVNFSTTQIVPVTDITIGGTAQLTNNLTFSAGYLLSAWHDLGNRATTTLEAPPGQAIVNFSHDDGNILAFDGIFVRGEYTF